MRAKALVALLLFGCASPAWAEVPSIPTLFGKTRNQITKDFPGESSEIPKWNGFQKVYLFFNTAGEFDKMTAVLEKPVSAKEAIAIVKERLGIELSFYKPITTPAAFRFEAPGGGIRSLTLKRDFPNPTISEITITSFLAQTK